jgi:hypothetical protein
MVNKMKIDERILRELNRYNNINSYIFEQEAIPEPEGGLPVPEIGIPAPDATLATTGPITTEPTPVIPETDPDVEKIDATGASEEETPSTEEMDITDLVTSQKNVEQKQEEYFKNLFTQLDGLQNKLSEMDGIVTKLNDIETKIEKYRERTPQEKLELRSLDSGPYTQKLSDFFADKEEDMEQSGKNEYILTSDEVTDFTPNEIKNTFVPPTEEDTI